MTIKTSDYGVLADGRSVQLFTLRNLNGLCAKISNYGGIITELHVPDRVGVLTDVALGKDSLADYLKGHPYFGCITGRVAGRISGANFKLDGTSYPLINNDGPNCLHGGQVGYDKVLWDASIIDSNDIKKLRLSYSDLDGNNGFPGQIDCIVTYALLADNSLEITYDAVTTKSTPFNITNHSYFNLCGAGNGDILGHQMQIFASTVASTDANGTLLGRCDKVVDGYNDFRVPVTLSERELNAGNADIHYCLDAGRCECIQQAAHVYEPQSGRQMDVYTTEPGVQFYAGLVLDDSGKNGIHYKKNWGFALETQDYADSVNYPQMGGAILHPGNAFRSKTLYKFSTR
ncbi:MAG: aldose epimerase family protein [Verrucomicrobiota bacterium]|nr:aldose epimerase family protein [Verrucomicrobiota bacterium]